METKILANDLPTGPGRRQHLAQLEYVQTSAQVLQTPDAVFLNKSWLVIPAINSDKPDRPWMRI